VKALLLGPNGQLGTDIRAAFEAGGTPVSVLTPLGRDAVDLSDIEAATAAIAAQDFDVLVNCSSYHKTDEVEGNAQAAITINAHLVARLAAICGEKRARLVHVSTDYVFGGQEKRSPLIETDAPAPLNVYGASKLMGESLAIASGADVLILRVASLFGVAGASGKGGNFVETMIRFGKERGALKVVADQIMSPTATMDIADALMAMLKAGAPSGIWHVVNSGQASWAEFAARIIERAGVAASVSPIPSSEYPTPAKRPPWSVLDNARLGQIHPMRPWQDALDAYLQAKGYRG
jgi:dTDP-4-dehydrorhamnose reductase